LVDENRRSLEVAVPKNDYVVARVMRKVFNMRFSHKDLKRVMAVGLVAAFVICSGLPTATQATTLNDKKTFKRAQKELREGDFENAELILRELVAKDALNKDARLALSFALLKQRRLQEAYDHAARVLVADPASARAHALLGQAILASGDFKESVEEFRTALAMNQNESMAVAGLAMVDFYENRLAECVKGLRKAVSMDGNEPDYIFSLGQAAARYEMFKEAADAYERFLAIAHRTDADRRERIRGLINFLRYLGRQGQLYVSSGRDSTAMSFETIDGRPILKVRINGQREPLRFVLDTGSGMSVISEQTAKRLGLQPISRGGMARAVGGAGKFEIVYGFLSSLEVGEVRVENVPVYIRHFYDDKVPVDGYLGLSVITRFFASVDYGERTFKLVKPRQTDSLGMFDKNDTEPRPVGEDFVEIPVRTTSSGFLSGEVRLEGIDKTQNFIIDTGASVSVVSEKLAELEGLADFMTPTRLRVFGAAGVTENVKTMLLPRVMLGSLIREQISVAILDLESINETTGFTQAGILGSNFLRHFRVSFDFRRGVIRLEPLNKSAKSAGSAVQKM
jgi:predicted aspartyl protease/Flp pilus assembly protein TadD